MRLILNEYIHGLGHEGDIVTVKRGFALNFLLPKKKAVRPTEENLKRFEETRAERVARGVKLKESTLEVAKFLEEAPFIVESKASQEGRLYGTVRAQTLFNALQKKFLFITKESVILPFVIKEVGEYTFQLRLHSEVPITATVYVFSSESEALAYIEERDKLAEIEARKQESKRQEALKEAEAQLEIANAKAAE